MAQSQIVTQNDVKHLGTILSVWAHPDDETFVAGGLLAAAVQNGQRVICITATRGEEGQSPDELRWPSGQMGQVRTKELEAAFKELRIIEHIWLSYRDGHCATADQAEAAAKIANIITTHQPDSIITFGSDGLTGHPDHQAVSRWANEGAKIAGSKAQIFHAVCEPMQYEQFLIPLDKQINLFFNIDKPQLVPAAQCAIAFELPPHILQQKLRALAAQPSQMERTLAAVPEAAQKGTFGFEYFVLA